MLRVVLAENVAWISAKRFLHVKKEIRISKFEKPNLPFSDDIN